MTPLYRAGFFCQDGRMKNRFVIFDGNAILHRAWHAMPPLATKDGRVVSAAYGFTVMLMKALNDTCQYVLRF